MNALILAVMMANPTMPLPVAVDLLGHPKWGVRNSATIYLLEYPHPVCRYLVQAYPKIQDEEVKKRIRRICTARLYQPANFGFLSPFWLSLHHEYAVGQGWQGSDMWVGPAIGLTIPWESWED